MTLRILMAAHTQAAQDVVSYLVTPALSETHRNRSIRCGREASIAAANIPLALQTPGRLMAVFITGHDKQEWITLAEADKTKHITPYGVVVLGKSPEIWERLTSHQGMRFLINASGIHSHTNEQRFPQLQDAVRIINVEPIPIEGGKQIAILLQQIAERESHAQLPPTPSGTEALPYGAEMP